MFSYRRCRKVEPGKTPYQLLPDTLIQNESMVTIDLFNKDTGVSYVVQFTSLNENTFRLHINEKNPLHPRYENEYALQDQPQKTKLDSVEKTAESITVVKGENKAILYVNPFKINLYSQGVLTISANARGLMRFEHLRTKLERYLLLKDNYCTESFHVELYNGKLYIYVHCFILL